MKAGRKNLANEYIITNVQRHQLSKVHQMVEQITRPIIHGDFWHHKPPRRLKVDNMKVKRRGEHII